MLSFEFPDLSVDHRVHVDDSPHEGRWPLFRVLLLTPFGPSRCSRVCLCDRLQHLAEGMVCLLQDEVTEGCVWLPSCSSPAHLRSLPPSPSSLLGGGQLYRRRLRGTALWPGTAASCQRRRVGVEVDPQTQSQNRSFPHPTSRAHRRHLARFPLGSRLLYTWQQAANTAYLLAYV